MRTTDGRDLMFAGAGLVWGVVTVFRGIHQWKGEQRRNHGGLSCSVGALPIGPAEYPAMILTGIALAIGCVAYLLWSIWPA